MPVPQIAGAWLDLEDHEALSQEPESGEETKQFERAWEYISKLHEGRLNAAQIMYVAGLIDSVYKLGKLRGNS